MVQVARKSGNEAEQGRTLLEAREITKSFALPGGSKLDVLSNINLSLRVGEIVALLGKSGSGKSTLLRILAGLIPATSGQVIADGKPLVGTNPATAMVFQNFALQPWLNVLQNVELGLEARGVQRIERTKRALKAIDLIGLDGFESAYPRELSNGMRQRVGLARALVVNPDVLLMDEPFSALDVLTAENLRNEIIELWMGKKFGAKAILMITHNIEEAVYLADRILILGSTPGVIRAEVRVDLQHWRERKSFEFTRKVDEVFAIMTNPEADVDELLAKYNQAVADYEHEQEIEEQQGSEEEDSEAEQVEETAEVFLKQTTEQAQGLRLPQAKVGGIAGLIELIDDQGGRADIFRLAQQLNFEVDDLLPITDALDMLDFAEVKQGDIVLIDKGRQFANADIQERKQLFRDQLLTRVPLIDSMNRTLQMKSNHTLDAEFFLDILDQRFTPSEARRQFKTATEWGRYAELFEYDAASERIYVAAENVKLGLSAPTKQADVLN